MLCINELFLVFSNAKTRFFIMLAHAFCIFSFSLGDMGMTESQNSRDGITKITSKSKGHVIPSRPCPHVHMSTIHTIPCPQFSFS